MLFLSSLPKQILKQVNPKFLRNFHNKDFTVFTKQESWMKPFVLVLCSEVLSVELLCLLIILLPTHVVTYLHSMFFSHFHFFDPAAVPFCELFSTSMGGTTNLSEGQVELFWSNQSCLSWGCLTLCCGSFCFCTGRRAWTLDTPARGALLQPVRL